MHSLQPLFSSMRAHGPVLLASTTEPAAELLALVWGPRFDREHGRYLAQSVAQNRPALDHALDQAADTFDRLPAMRQQRLRQLLRHHAGGTIRA
ncbi:hypothetical protein HZ993_11560 [Rhodoferax sp. AJA081-3]|uniref:hypothetical protein n=1 Tax=Rhodoferax sp. AJA081-3 TaxID=2752316 RepID=UPI001ADF8173|nr:hypothetical protein [Rhodoferax sp. AJA081-3]QTN30374.1 hypothetical protein HZ993_11560 [Rhodoferax sp. AJA081-3]